MSFASQGLLDFFPSPIVMEVKEYKQLDHLRTYAREPGTVKWVKGHMKTGDVFYDIGANVGAISFIARAATQGNCMVYAFEPGYANFSALCNNIYLNRAEQEIIPFPVALGVRNCILNFQYTNLEAGFALHSLEDSSRLDHDTSNYVFRHPVLVFGLDNFIKEFGLKEPNYIKLDVDGGELQVLKGAIHTLQNSTLCSIQVEIKETSLQAAETFSILKSSGFRIARRNESKTPDTPNYIFERT